MNDYYFVYIILHMLCSIDALKLTVSPLFVHYHLESVLLLQQLEI